MTSTNTSNSRDCAQQQDSRITSAPGIADLDWRLGHSALTPRGLPRSVLALGETGTAPTVAAAYWSVPTGTEGVPVQKAMPSQRPVLSSAGQEVGWHSRPPQQPARARGAAAPPHLHSPASPDPVPPSAAQRIAPPVARYHGSDRLADLALAVMFRQDMFRSSVRSAERVDLVVGCLLLIELSQAQLARVDSHGVVHPVGHAAGHDSAADAMLRQLRAEPSPQPAGKWLTFLALDRQATTLVWRRLIDRKVAVERPYRWPRRGSSFELTNPLPTEWAGHFLRALISDRTEIPAAAATLWHALRALRLDDSYLELPPPIRQHLVEHAAIPADLASLFQALERCLVHRSTQL